MLPDFTPAPIPASDPERVAALHALLILDTLPEQRFDRIVEFAAQEFEVPMAMISLIDRDRQWVKSTFGLVACESSRDISMCAHAILEPRLLVLADTQADPRFAGNPFVTGAPFVRAYIGAPLVLPSGHAVGTLCIMDTVPRVFDALALSILMTLRDLVVMELIEQKGQEDAASGDAHV